MVTVGEAWRAAQARLEAAGLDPAPGEGKRIAGHVLGLDFLQLSLHENNIISLNNFNLIEYIVTRREAGEPLAYVLGEADFWGRAWVVWPGVLVPRPDTEVLVREGLARLPEGGAMVAEMGVGSGCVIGSLLMERPGLAAYGTDVSAEALAVARENVPHGCVFLQAEGLEGVPEGLDMVVSNPPYIAEGEYDGLEAGVREFEPRIALVGVGENADGLAHYRYLATAAWGRLKPGGWLVVEIGFRQRAAVEDIFKGHGWVEVACVPDLAGRDRVVAARKPV